MATDGKIFDLLRERERLLSDIGVLSANKPFASGECPTTMAGPAQHALEVQRGLDTLDRLRSVEAELALLGFQVGAAS